MLIENIINFFKISNKTYRKSIILPVLLGSIMLFSCENDIEQIKTITSNADAPNFSAKDIVTTYSDSAKIKVKLISPELERFEQKEEPYTEFPKGIKIIFYNDSQQVDSKITANYSKYFEKKGIWEAKDNVVVINKKKEKLNTEYLVWDKKKAIIYTNEFVKITTPDGIFYGEGMKANQDFSSWEISKPKGTISVKK